MARARRYSRSEFTPKNSNKYIGTYPIVARSSWERAFMVMLDEHPSVAQWASESIKVPYKNPLTGKHTIYVPDFLVSYVDKTGKPLVELIEIKPMKHTLAEQSRSQADNAQVVINRAKWIAANIWAKKHGMKFRVITEAGLFLQATGKKGRRKKR